MERKHFISERYQTFERPVVNTRDDSNNLSIFRQSGCSEEESMDESMEPQAYPPDSSLLQPIAGKARIAMLKGEGVCVDKVD